MRFSLAAVALLMLAGCASPPVTTFSSSTSSASGGPGVTHNVTGPALPQRLTWNLDASLRMAPTNATAGHLTLTGGSDPLHGRDLLQFVGEPVASPVWLSNFTVHLIFENTQAWTTARGGVEVWFGYDLPADTSAAATFPVTGGVDPGTRQAASRFDVRINDTVLTPGGVGIPAGARPIFFVAVTGSQSAAAPLLLDVGGDASTSSHVHPTVQAWNRTAHHIVALAQQAGTLAPAFAGAGPGASAPVSLELPAGADGFVATVVANGTTPADLDIQVLGAGGAFVAESNGPGQPEALRFYAANLNVTGRSLSVQVVDGGASPAQYWLRVYAFVPGAGP